MKPIRRILLISGGRDNPVTIMIHSALESWKPDLIVHGGAFGTDTIADRWAKYNGVARTVLDVCKEDYELYGPRAPIMRNTTMVNHVLDTYCETTFGYHTPRPGFTVAGMFFPGKNGTRDCFVKWTDAGLNYLQVDKYGVKEGVYDVTR